jgi:lipopolysaccharide biosynthesis glycosyltransferase
MVIDLDAWRAAGIEQSCLEAARRFQHRTKWLDQHVLNTCLAGRWGALPPVWNRQFSLDLFPDWRCSPYDERDFEEARRRPAIIHFCTHTKPWHAFSDHPRDDVLAYRAALRATAFGGAAAARPSLLRRAAQVLAAPHRRLLDTTAAAFRANRRKHALQAMLPSILKLAILHPWTLATVPLAVVRERVAIRLGHVSASR